jgi:hypothetical protein
MRTIIQRSLFGVVYVVGSYASYVDYQKPVCKINLHILPTLNINELQSISSFINLYTNVSYIHAKYYYKTRLNPIIYSTAWPVVQFTMASSSVFIGSLSGFLEWNERNKRL